MTVSTNLNTTGIIKVEFTAEQVHLTALDCTCVPNKMVSVCILATESLNEQN